MDKTFTIMSSYKFINLKSIEITDSMELSILKSQFNRLATQFNVNWPDLSLEKRNELYDKLKAIEDQIINYE